MHPVQANHLCLHGVMNVKRQGSNQRQLFVELPDHVIQMVFAHLGPDDLLRLASVCRLFHMISSTNSAWIGSVSKPFLSLLLSISKLSFKLDKLSIKSLVRSVWERSRFFKGFVWERLSATNHDAMAGMFHSSTYLPHLSCIIQFGGSKLNANSQRQPFETFTTNDLFLLNPTTMEWHRPKTTGDAPPKLHSALVARIRTGLYFLGGCFNDKLASEGCPKPDASVVYMLETGTIPMVWHRLKTTGDLSIIPVSRAIHAAYAVGDEIVLVGAWSGDYHRWHDVRVLDTLTLRWRSVHTKHGYCDGQDTSFIIDQNICSIDVIDRCLYRLNIANSCWSNKPIAMNTMLRSISASVPIANKVICFDAQPNLKPWVLDVANCSWMELDILGSDCPDLLHGYSAVQVHGCVIISGYSRTNRPEPQLWVLRPVTF